MKQFSLKPDIRCLIIIIQCITVSNGYERPPTWDVMSIVSILENTTIGTKLTSLSATGHNNAEVKIEPYDDFTRDTVNITVINTSTFNFKTSVDIILNNNQNIDADRGKTSIDLFFVAYDNRTPKDKVPRHQLTLYSVDVNDNPPQFEFLFYETEVNENESPGHAVQTVSASDPDRGAGGIIVFSLKPVGQSASLYNNTFELNCKDKLCTVKMIGSLDYERLSFYQYEIVATDSDRNHPLNSTASLVIKVKDVQDMPPVFDRQTYEANINENAKNGTKINVGNSDVRAVDGDRGIPNKISYSIIQDKQCSSKFTIDSASGVILTDTDKLDRDAAPFDTLDGICELTVTAKEVNTSGTPQYGIDNATVTVRIKVNDMNDNLPRFSANGYNATIPENRTLARLKILNGSVTVFDIDQDEDNSKINVTVICTEHSTECALQPDDSTFIKRGTIELALQNDIVFDYEEQKSATIKLVASNFNNTRDSVTATVFIDIIDVNDNIPTFNEKDYTAYAVEDYGTMQNGNRTEQIIKYVTATDRDSGIRGEITFTLEGQDEFFIIEKINSSTARIKTNTTTTEVLDRETKDQYTLTVIATDGEGSRSTVQMIVHITDVNDNAPEFKEALEQISVKENQMNFTRKIIYKATDNDKGNNASVRFLIQTPEYLKSNITINDNGDNSGSLKLKAPLDYEELNSSDGSFTVMVVAYDLGIPCLNSSIPVTIYVQDENDNDPIFSSQNYSMHLTENSVEGTYVGRVNATDNDGTEANNGIRFYIDGGEGADKFRMNRETGNITVDKNARIDREEHVQYTLSVVVYDTGIHQNSAFTTVNINIIDVNDEPPTFVESSYSAHVNESSAANASIINCTAHDPDLNSDLKYSIIATYPVYTDNSNQSAENLFTVTNRGVIHLNHTVDREIFSKVLLTLKVEDVNGNTTRIPQTATATITITIDDSNDNPPEFTSANTFKIQEGFLGGVVTMLSATDKDLSNVLTYAITDDQHHAFFIDNPLSGTIMRNISIELDRESSTTVNITVSVNDGLHTVLQNITFVLQDINDNAPTFGKSSYTTHLEEDNGTTTYSVKSVYNLTATDRDVGVNANLTYHISGGNNRSLFQIRDKYKCDIVVVGNIDREQTSKFILQLIATDSPSNKNDQKTGTTTLTVLIDDVNDNAPTFTQVEYSQHVLENIGIGQPVISLSAVDRDVQNNSLFTYEIPENQTNFFTIDGSSGLIRVSSNLTNKYGSYSFTVRAVDLGGLYNTTEVTVVVEDVNNNPPVFVNLPKSASVYECARNGTIVIKVNSSDLDAGENSRVEYSLVGNQSDLTIDGNNGEIKTIHQLDVRRIPEYKLRIQIKDHGTPRLSSEQELTVLVIDINDHPPEFKQNTSRTQVSENVANKTIITVKADDEDIRSILHYSIAKNFEDSFSIGEETGDLTITKPIDREEHTSVQLKIIAKDVTTKNIGSECDSSKINNIKDTTEMTLFIDILDQNDNPPIFSDSKIKKGIRRTVKLNTVVIDLEEWVLPDPDTIDNRKHTYAINGNITYSTQSLGRLIRATKLGGVQECGNQVSCLCLSNSTLVTNMLFEENMKGSIYIPVIAWDAAGNSTAVVELDIIADDQTAAMLIHGSKNFVQTNQQEILEIASRVTGKVFVADGIESKVTNGIADAEHTYLYFHVSSGDQIIPASAAKKLFDDKSAELGGLLSKYNLKTITEYQEIVTDNDKSVINIRYVLMAVCALLALTILITGVCFCGSVARYKRKLKAATTSVTVDTSPKETQPGTNVYARNQNPVFNREVDAEQVDYDRFEEDNVSVGSYDSNQFNKKDQIREDEEKGATMDMYDDDFAPIETETDGLAMVLARHKREKAASQENLAYSPSEHLYNGVDNSSFDSLETTEV